MIVGMRRGLLFSCVLACSLACTASSSEPSSREAPANSGSASADQDQALADRAFELVRTSQTAGFIRHDLDAYIEPWSASAHLILGRGPEPGPRDVELDHAQLRATKALRFTGERPPSSFRMKHELLSHELRDGGVVLQLRTTSGMPGSTEVMNESFVLEGDAATLKIVENRAWPLSTDHDGVRTDFGPELWAKHDAEVEALLARGELAEAASLCSQRVDVGRWRELAERVVEQPDAGADAWASLAWARLISGAVPEAKAAAATAKSLDPQLDLGPLDPR